MTEHSESQPAPGWAFGIRASVVANLLVLVVVAYVACLETFFPDFYYSSLQEDKYLEWGTFWAFIGSAVVGVVIAARQWRGRRLIPWFAFGVALFCVFVAMEEISWGQRVLGYRPPAYFLENNFQQEFNVHNIFSTDIRKLVLKGVILGYGVILPLIALLGPVRGVMKRLAVVVPTVGLVPTFAATYGLYEWYPWKYTGETVELMLGLGFLFAAIIGAPAWTPMREEKTARFGQPAVVAGAWTLVVGLGFANAALARIEHSAVPEYVELARVESQALKDDFLAMTRSNRNRLVTSCDLHKRIYTFERSSRKPYLYSGKYASLVNQGMAEERASFFLDPWNTPYWIRDRCDSDDSDARRVFVYSFGPNRRRDSNAWEIRGDDIGVYIRR